MRTLRMTISVWGNPPKEETIMTYLQNVLLLLTESDVVSLEHAFMEANAHMGYCTHKEIREYRKSII